MIELDCGIKIWGSPYTPEFNNWAFPLKTEEAKQELWQQIPNDIDILMTHGPPKGILDKNTSMIECGDEVLRKEV